MIEISHLSKEFGQFAAVRDLSFDVAPGEVLGFLGPNGAGKTTTMRMITGFIAPSSGSVAIYGHDIQSDPIGAKRRLGYLPEGAPAYGDMTPAGFLAFVADIRGLRGAQKKQRLDAMAAELELQSVWHRPIETLSKGFKPGAQAVMMNTLVTHGPTNAATISMVVGLCHRAAFRSRFQIATRPGSSRSVLNAPEIAWMRATPFPLHRMTAPGTG